MFCRSFCLFLDRAAAATTDAAAAAATAISKRKICAANAVIFSFLFLLTYKATMSLKTYVHVQKL